MKIVHIRKKEFQEMDLQKLMELQLKELVYLETKLAKELSKDKTSQITDIKVQLS